MADGTTVDNLQIEISASSDDAVSRISKLTASLKTLQSATKGKFGDVKKKMKDVGGSADHVHKQAKALEEIQKKKEALERATARPKSVVPKDVISNSVESAKKKYDDLIRYINQNSGRITRDAASAALSEIRAETDALERILDQFGDAVAPPELNAVLDALKHAEKKFQDIWANPAPQKIDWGAVQRQTESFGPQESADKAEVIETEGSLERKRGIIQKIGDLISKISGEKLDIKTPEGLKDILGKDLSLQNLIPKGIEAALGKAGEAFQKLTDKVVAFAAAHPAAAAALVVLKSAAQTVFRAIKDFAKFSFSTLKNGFELVASGAKKLVAALKTLVKSGIKKAVSGAKSLAASFGAKFTRPLKKATEVYNKWKSALLRIAFYRVVRSAIKMMTDAVKTGVDNLYQYSKIVGTDFAPAMDKLATSALYLKNSIGAIAAPLIEAVAPAVDYLVDKFVELLNVIGKTFAALTGKDVYSQARKHAVEYAESAEEAKKETEKFKKFLLGIDELNIMPSQDKEEEKKNPLEDYASMFEEVEVPVDGMDWAKQIREAIENGEWYSVGKIVAKKLNELLDGWDAYAWGKKLGEMLTKGLEIAFGFLENFNFETLGGKISGAINGLFDGIDWELLGQTIGEKFNALFNFIYGFATNLDWGGIGLHIAESINGFLDQFDAKRAAEAVSKFITGLFELINTAITETNWALLGQRLAEFINNVDWYGAIYGGLSIITNGLAALKSGIDSFLKNWEWEDMAEQIYTAINDAWNNVNWYGLGETLSNLVSTALQFTSTLISGLDWGKFGRDIGNFLIGINWTEVFAGLADAIASGINAAIALLGNMIDTISPGIGLIAQNIGQKFNEFIASIEWSEMGQVISDGIKSAFTFMISFLDSVDWEGVGAAIVDFLLGIDWAGLLAGLGSLIGKLFVGVLKAVFSNLPGLLEIGAQIVKGILDGLASAWQEIVNFIADGIKGIGDTVGGFISNIFGGNKSGGKSASSSNYASNRVKAAMPQNFEAPKAYASGGFPQKGEMFIAREAGPELVGKIGQKNTVANNEQIQSGIAEGVRDANTDVVNAVYAMASMIVKSIEDKNTDISLDGQSLARGMQTYEKRLASTQGRSLID